MLKTCHLMNSSREINKCAGAKEAEKPEEDLPVEADNNALSEPEAKDSEVEEVVQVAKYVEEASDRVATILADHR